ncbi:hypothetical protein SCORR_v1c01500 [Spiroplasma corruscae]|uniref:Uncharacterized protein n=1 Tax=Spiroplasma corruscae TaxID=216934 RepID=A0A222EN61_9MOLU|nr:hypothetical protein [Spiroplasma corruscae]ASP27925.1 hypothetical protein SCORR_v1c01500 [Spiroplasma corruscae]
MKIRHLISTTLEEFIGYLNNECFKGLTIKNNDLKIELNISNLYSNTNQEIDALYKQINYLRQENQESLNNKSCDLSKFARTEMNLISASSGIDKLVDISEEFEDLGFWNSDSISNYNEKFVIKKINSSAQSLKKDFKKISDILKNASIFIELDNLLNKIATTENLETILKLSSELLLKQNRVLELDYFFDYNKLTDEYNWIHDFVKISHVNAEFVSLVITIEVLTNSMKDKIYVPTAIKA